MSQIINKMEDNGEKRQF